MSRPATILVVEDSATQALELMHVLERAGFEAECGASAEDALAMLNARSPDLLVTDYHLPGITGAELCRRLRMNLATRGLPILMLTSEREGEIERHVLESGADDYVPKQQGLDFVLLRIQALLRKSRVQDVLFGTVPFAAARLLLVEDSATYRELLSAELAQDGYALAVVSSGSEALERVATQSFDGIVLDLVLPDIGAAEICRRVVEAYRTLDHAPVILGLTASADRDLLTSVLAGGADDVVEKSRDLAVIKARLRALLRRKHLHEENRRIAEEFRARELEVLRANTRREAAEERAGMADRLEKANRELKETQAQLVQSAKMASLGQLVAGIAHEINNPLAFVMNHQSTVEGLLNGLGPAIEPNLAPTLHGKWRKAAQRLGDMRQGLERIEDLVLKLRTFSRLDEGELKHVKIEESIESVLTMLRHRMQKRIAVTRRYGDVKVLSCYPGPLNQVLMNLLSNAIDAIEGKGEITITTGKDGSMFFIAISDNGKGMPPAVQERIFEPFYTTKPVGEGTGLGLSISYGIVRRHAGSIGVHSEEGKGTEMVVRIPLELRGSRDE